MKFFQRKNLRLLILIYCRSWKKRPDLAAEKIFILEDKYTGKSYKEKVKEIRASLKEKNVDYNIISSLDDIAWIYNFRGDDVQHNPVGLSFTVISEKKASLYIDENKLNKEAKKYFKDNKSGS